MNGTGSRVDTALVLAKKGNVAAVRTLLGLTSDQVADADLLDGLIAFEEGMALFQQDRHSDAVSHLRKAASVLAGSTDSELVMAVTLAGNLSDGISRLVAGDAHGAYTILDSSADFIHKLAFFYPDLKNVALKVKALSLIALARAAVNLGNLETAQSWLAKADDVHDELLASIDAADPASSIWIAPVLATRIEIAILFARVEIEALRLDGASYRLESVEQYHKDLLLHIDKFPEGPSKRVLRVVAGLYDVLFTIRLLLEKTLARRETLTRAHVRVLADIDRRLYEIRADAAKAGDAAAGYLYTINQLSRLQESILRMGSVSKADFGRFAGLVSLGSLVVLMIVTYLTVHPTGWTAAGYFFGDLVISLAAGFGYGALRFKPLLKLISATIEQKKDLLPDSPATPTKAAG